MLLTGQKDRQYSGTDSSASPSPCGWFGRSMRRCLRTYPAITLAGGGASVQVPDEYDVLKGESHPASHG